MRLTIMTVLLAVSSATLAPAATDLTALQDRAVAAYRAGEFEQAAEIFKEMVAADPTNPNHLYSVSRSLERAGKIDEAIPLAEQVQRMGFFQRARMDYRLAQLHAAAGHPDAALDWLERALEHRYENRPSVAGDEAFAGLRDHPRFRRLAGMLPDGELSRDDGWRFDVDYLVEEARRMHAGPGRPALSEAFGREAAALRASIPERGDDELLIGTMRLVSLLGDGHSGIFGPDDDTPLAFNALNLPYKFYLFPEGLYIVDAAGEWTRHRGHRVVRFGELDAATVLERMSAYRGVDNPMTWNWMGPQFYVGRLALLKSVGATDADDSVELTLESPDGEVVTERVPGGNHEHRRKLRPWDDSPPRFLSRVDTHYWFEPLPDHDALYFQFNQVRDADDESIEAFAGRLHAALSAQDPSTLIVDVRHNNGGNNTLVTPLVRTLVAYDVADPDHRIVVLTGRNTFSACQNFINRVERWTDAEFAGEPSSSSPNFVGESTDLLLPRSRIRGSISTRYWQDSDPGDERAWIAMDLPVELTAADYFAGRDPVLQAVLAGVGPRRER